MVPMTSYVALVRAVNVGGTGKLPMSDLKAICETAGLKAVRTYIASGNVVFRSELSEPRVKAALETHLAAYAGKPVGVLVRTAAQMAQVVARNPFVSAPGNRVAVIFLDSITSSGTLEGVVGRADHEQLEIGHREIYVHYARGMAASKLRIPAAKAGTARNMNTVAKLAAMAEV
jgi:uncharacterized protein (DUF1697 family)